MSSSNRASVPEARAYLDQLKFEIAGYQPQRWLQRRSDSKAERYSRRLHGQAHDRRSAGYKVTPKDQ